MKHTLTLLTIMLVLGIAAFANGSTISGIIIDGEESTPISDATINLWGESFYETNSDEAGNFLLEGVIAGEYALNVFKMGYRHYQSELQVAEGDTLYLTIELEAHGGGGGWFEFGEVEGTVTDAETQEPIEGADVFVGGWGHGNHTLTDENGYYHLENVFAGEAEIIAEAFGYAAVSQEIVVVENEVLEVDFQMEAIGFGSIIGSVIDAETGDAIEGAIILLGEIGQFPGEGLETTTDMEGLFSFDEVPAGEYRIKAHVMDYQHESQEILVVEGETTEVIFELDTFGSGGNGTGTVYGTVIDDETEEPIQGATLMLWRFMMPQETITDENGYFEFENVEEGEHWISAFKEGYEEYSDMIELDEGDSLYLEIEMNTFGGGGGSGILDGTVLDEETGEPIADAQVHINFEWWGHDFTITDENGYFLFVDVPSGEVEVNVSAMGYQEYTEEVEILDGETTTLEILLGQQAVGTLTGTVINMDTQEPIEGAEVMIYGHWQGGGGHGWGHAIEAETDENGMFSADLPEGEYTIQIWQFGFEHYFEEIEIIEDEILELTIELDPWFSGTFGSLTGTIIDAETQETIEDAEVMIFSDEYPIFDSHRTTDENGQFTFDEVPTGTIYVITFFEGYAQKETEVQIIEGEITDITIELEALVFVDDAITGTIIDFETGDPIEGATVSLNGGCWGHGGNHYEVVTDAQGYYEFDGVAVGLYNLKASAWGYFQQNEDVEIIDGETLIIDFELEPFEFNFEFGIVEGTVTDSETGEPIAEAMVRVLNPCQGGRCGGWHNHMAFTDEDGFYTIEVPVGTYDIRAGHPEYLPEELADQEILEDQILTLDFALTSADTSGILCNFSGSIVEQSFTVEFTDMSSGYATDWLWTFGDGTTSTEENPTHIYAEQGEYTVTLETWGIGGWDMEEKTDYVVLGVPTGVEDDLEIAAPVKFTMGNFPNPFNPTTSIYYDLPNSAKVNLTIYDATGKMVWKTNEGHQEAGSYEIKWNGVDSQGKTVDSGVYFYKLNAGNDSQVNRMILLK